MKERGRKKKEKKKEIILNLTRSETKFEYTASDPCEEYSLTGRNEENAPILVTAVLPDTTVSIKNQLIFFFLTLFSNNSIKKKKNLYGYTFHELYYKFIEHKTKSNR